MSTTLWIVLAIGLVLIAGIGAAWRWRENLRPTARKLRAGSMQTWSAAKTAKLATITAWRTLAANTLNALVLTAWIVVWAMLALAIPAVGVLSGLFIGMVLSFFIIPLLPGAFEPFMIRPNKLGAGGSWPYPPSRHGFFTDLQPGRVKAITSVEGAFIRMIMDYDGRRFNGEDPSNSLTSNMEEYWEVVPSQGLPDSHPIPFPAPKGAGETTEWQTWALYAPFSIIWWMWKRLVYALTGAVWVGIPWFRTIKIYPLQRFDVRTQPDGARELILKIDYSDHYRVRDFQMGVRVPEADTQGMISVRVEFNEVAKVTNPYQVAFNTDDQWPLRFTATVADAITSYVRSTPIKEVLGAADLAGARRITSEVTRLSNEALGEIGIEVIATQYIDISPVDRADAEKLGDVERASVERDAAIIRADAEAARLKKVADAIKDNPHAETVLQTDAAMQMAESIKNNQNAIVTLSAPTSTQTINLASFRELRKIREQEGESA